MSPPRPVTARRREILDIAARMFALRGYRGTSIRDIGEEAGLMGGSLYHHIKSKDALFVEIHDQQLDMAEARMVAAIDAAGDDPWARLEAACILFAQMQTQPGSETFPLMNDFAHVPSDVRERLIVRRDRFEDVFRRLVATLPLPDGFDRSVYRNLLLSQLNNLGHWFKPGRLAAADVGRQVARLFRHDAEKASPASSPDAAGPD